MVFSSFIPRLPEIRDRIGGDLRLLGLLLTAGSIGGLVGSALCGSLIGRFGTKRVMTGGALGLIGVLPAVGLATVPVAFLAAVMAMHLFDVLTDVAMNMQGSRLSSRRATPVMNRLHGLWSVGTVIGGGGAAIAATAISLQTHLLLVSLLLLLTLSYVTPGLLVDDLPEQAANREDTPTGRIPRSSRAFLGLTFGALAVVSVTVEMVPHDWAAIRLTEDLAMGPGGAGLGFVAVTGGMVIGRFGGDTAIARFGRRKLTMGAVTLSAVGLAIATLIPVATISILGFGLTGLGAAIMFPTLYDEAARAPGRPGALLGVMTAGIRLGALIMPISVGALASTSALTVGQAMAIVGLPAAVLFLVATARMPDRSSPGVT